MIISLNWLKKFTDITKPIDELATLIGERLVEIEEITDLGAKYENAVIVRVVECKKHEDSDHLNVTKVDDGGVTPDVERDENGYIQVVCGAPNVREGLLVVWLPPHSIVPDTYYDAEPFMLGTRALRGVMSNGMIASARELDLFDEHEGILEIDKKDIKPGTKLRDAYELDDFLFDIENKSLTHRPDAFGIIGFAREVSAIQGKPFTTPDWLKDISPSFSDKQGDVEAPTISIDNPELCDRYQAVVVSNADALAKSPLHIQTYLSRVGVRPINAVVDVTNYLMMLTGQPLHAFDYDKLVKAGGGRADIHVRSARAQEKLELLDGRTTTLAEGDIVIAAGDIAIGLAGAMGGANTEIDEHTQTIIIESATFNLYNLRATQMRHGIFSEAITRFTKGQPAELTAPVLAKAVQLMSEFAGAVRVSDVAESYPGKATPFTVDVAVEKINATLGTHKTVDTIVDTLKNVEFGVTVDESGILYVEPPYWRNDIHIPEDIIEEVGRLNGFDTIMPSLPKRDFTAIKPNRFDQTRSDIRDILVRAGANEALTYSFVHGDVLTKAGQKPEGSYRIINSISPELQYYRQTLTPSLLAAIYSNVKQGYDRFALFEVNKAHPKEHGVTDEGVPVEVDMVALTLTSKKLQEGAPFYEAKKVLDYLGHSLGLELIYSPIETDPASPIAAPFEHRRSALVTDSKTDTFVGIVGEYKRSVTKAFKLPDYTAGFEIGSIPLLEAIQKLTSVYSPISRYPSSERDICFQVNRDVSYRQVVDSAKGVLKTTGLETAIAPVDLYQPENFKDVKNITIRIRLTAHDHTLTGDEVAVVIEMATEAVTVATGATVI
jgi:phenylalanyl-tRNA synthetase beta chain